MSFSEKLDKRWRIIENVTFVFAFGFIMYKLISSYWQYTYDSLKGKGFIGSIIDPISTHQYYKSAVAVMFILNSTLVLWEIAVLTIKLLKQKKARDKSN